jgi:hypothetical protein
MPKVDLNKEPNVRLLDSPQGSRLEVEYSNYWAARGVPLKAKYRPSVATYQQWGTGGDRAGKARSKVPHKGQNNGPARALYVEAGSGKRRMVDAESVGL